MQLCGEAIVPFFVRLWIAKLTRRTQTTMKTHTSILRLMSHEISRVQAISDRKDIPQRKTFSEYFYSLPPLPESKKEVKS